LEPPIFSFTAVGSPRDHLGTCGMAPDFLSSHCTAMPAAHVQPLLVRPAFLIGIIPSLPYRMFPRTLLQFSYLPVAFAAARPLTVLQVLVSEGQPVPPHTAVASSACHIVAGFLRFSISVQARVGVGFEGTFFACFLLMRFRVGPSVSVCCSDFPVGLYFFFRSFCKVFAPCLPTHFEYGNL